jgi:hypothetical protein
LGSWALASRAVLVEFIARASSGVDGGLPFKAGEKR